MSQSLRGFLGLVNRGNRPPLSDWSDIGRKRIDPLPCSRVVIHHGMRRQHFDRLLSSLGLGLRQGAYCTACCWLVMALLFAFGVMNLAGIAALTVLVLLEKIVPHPRAFAMATGAILLVWGALIALP